MKKTNFKGYTWVSALALFAFLAVPVVAQQELPANTEAGQLSDAMAQTAGEYDAMNLNYIQSFGMQQKAWNDPLTHLGEGQTKPGYSRYTWTPDVVLPVRLREGMMTLINLPTWELIEKVHIGSPESFGGEIAAPNSLLVYADPTYIGVDTNMIVFGRSGNRYVFYLRSETYNTDKITHSVVDVTTSSKYTPVENGGTLGNFNGATATAAGAGAASAGGNAPGWSTSRGSLTPGGAQSPQVGLNTASTGPKDWLESIPVDPEKFRFDVEMYLPNPADVDIAPERVWRDDIFTYIDLGPKALTMVQRPVVNLIVQDSEVPVGFRTRGKNSRLIVVEAVGDLVLRNGAKIVCLKLRRDPALGLENVDYSGTDKVANTWTAPAQPDYEVDGNAGQNAGSQNGSVANANGVNGKMQQPTMRTTDQTAVWNGTLISQNGQLMAGSNGTMNAGLGMGATPTFTMSTGDMNGLYTAPIYQQKMAPLPAIPDAVKFEPSASAGIVSMIGQVSGGNMTATRQNIPTAVVDGESISIELASDPDISVLENTWSDIMAKNGDLLKGYEPYYSIDATADGDVMELFRLRVGPMKSVGSADALCQKLGTRGYSCSVIRVQ